jgi:beta-galactosidase GanA
MFTKGIFTFVLALGLLGQMAAAPAGDDTPRLERTGSLTRLMVDGQPFLMLAGELHNSSSSSLDYMKPIWPKLAAMNLNTVLAPVSWELLEPEEGKFEFELVDGLISAAKENHLHLVFLWFGSWKNGVSSYAPSWVKSDLTRFPRAQNRPGDNIETLSTFGHATQKADARAFAALMKHIREVDGRDHTVLMMQVENEVGVLGSARDHSAQADAAWNQPVPKALLSYLTQHKDALIPEFAETWRKAGSKTSGTWPTVFGDTKRAEEIFMAWHYAQYIDAVAAAGKTEYPLPMYVNAWLIQYPGQPGGEHPSGGPVSRVLDVWRAGTSHLDFFSPDIYLSDFRGVLAKYEHLGNPLFIPEARGQMVGGANALYAFGQGALGFSPFAIDSITGDESLPRAYAVLQQLSPLLARVSKGQIASVVQQAGETKAAVELGGYELEVNYQDRRRAPTSPTANAVPAAALIINSGPNEFVVAGQGMTITFAANSAGPPLVGLSEVDEGSFADGKWVPGRRLNGDETNGGNFIILRHGAPAIQRVRLYRHE